MYSLFLVPKILFWVFLFVYGQYIWGWQYKDGTRWEMICVQRYLRQMLLEEIGEMGQNKINEARVLVVGAGGLGCPTLTYLGAAGVGFIRIADFDEVSETNLNRQFFYSSADSGKNKAMLAREHLLRQNPNIHIETISEKVTKDNVLSLIKDVDIVVDCVDNIATREVLNEACVEKTIPLIEAGVQGYYGFLTILTKEGHCLDCLGMSGMDDNKGPVGIIGVTAGVLGCMQANECLKIILNIESDLTHQVLQYDGLRGTIEYIEVERDPNCNRH